MPDTDENKDQPKDTRAGTDVDLEKMAKAAEGDQPKLTVTKGHRPEEFYNDAQLAVYHQQQLEAMKEDHPDRAEAKRTLARARIAAAVTASVDPDLA